MAEQDSRSLEELFADIEETISRMEAPEVSLEESFLLYEKGMKDLKRCSDSIDQVEKKMLVLNQAGETEEF